MTLAFTTLNTIDVQLYITISHFLNLRAGEKADILVSFQDPQHGAMGLRLTYQPLGILAFLHAILCFLIITQGTASNKGACKLKVLSTGCCYGKRLKIHGW